MDSEWGFRLKNKNTTGITQYVVFHLDYGSKETPYIEMGGCESAVEIEPTNLTAIHDPLLPTDLILFPNHPNPFTDETTIRFSLAHTAAVTLIITDVLGREVRKLLNQELRSSGMQSIRFKPGELRPGVYFARLSVGATVVTGKMLLH
jgi:hypothetical protein